MKRRRKGISAFCSGRKSEKKNYSGSVILRGAI
jgi:hypothetical protein